MKKFLIAIFAIFVLASCGSTIEDFGILEDNGHKKNNGVILDIVSGSENKLLEPILQKYAYENGFNVKMHYKGSVDIMLKLKENTSDIDAVWPASSVWLNMGSNAKLKHTESIMRSPVVFGVKKNIAKELGWIGKEVSYNDIFEAIQNGKFTFAMTNATQSNSGLSGYLEFVNAFSNNPSQLTETDVNSNETKAKTSALLKKIDKSSGSSGWLKEMIQEKYDFIDAMVNYEALMIELNQELIKQNKEPLYVIYPKEGIVVADSPLSYVDNGTKEKEEAFQKLQTYLLETETQNKILDLGRRTGLGMNLENNSNVKENVFNKEWGIIKNIKSPVITYPKQKVIEEMLEMYQLSLRKPSMTVYALDVSGSMEGEGIDQLKQAMGTLLKKDIARKYLLQASQDDIHIIVPFNGQIVDTIEGKGNGDGTMSNLNMYVQNLQAGGGTNIYLPIEEGLKLMNKQGNQNKYFSSIILLTDGKSEGRHLLNSLENYDVPVFAIMFGNAQKSQLEEITKKFNGRVFDGRKDLINAFRKAKGYN